MPAHYLDPLAYIVLGVSVLIFLFGATMLSRPKSEKEARRRTGCVVAIAILMVLLSVLFGGCAVVILLGATADT